MMADIKEFTGAQLPACTRWQIRVVAPLILFVAILFLALGDLAGSADFAELGKGRCKHGRYAGEDWLPEHASKSAFAPKGVSLRQEPPHTSSMEACQEQCVSEDRCRFFSFAAKQTCDR